MKKVLVFLPILVAVSFTFFFLNSLIDDVPINWEELALGKETFSPHSYLQNGLRVYAKYEDKVIHCEALEGCSRNSYKKSGNKKILWLGNSQLHAINQFKNGQMLTSEHLFRKLLTKKNDLLTVSFPSANLQEHFVIFSSVSSDIELSKLIIGVVFDDFREEGVRFEIAKSFSQGDIRPILSNSEIGRQILKDNKTNTDIEDEFSGLNDSLQKQSEKNLNKFLEENTDLWNRRAYLRGYFFNLAYKTRNYIFNINPSSKRKMILPRYEKNWRALEEILKQAKKSNIEVLLYVAPIRNDVDIPYVKEEYENFKNDLKNLSLKHKSNFLNLEDLISAEDWGLKDSTNVTSEAELDYMHFQESAHKELSNALYDYLNYSTY